MAISTVVSCWNPDTEIKDALEVTHWTTPADRAGFYTVEVSDAYLECSIKLTPQQLRDIADAINKHLEIVC